MCNREPNVSQLVAGHTLVFAADTVSGHALAFNGRSPVQRTFACSSRPCFGIPQKIGGAGFEFPIARNSRHLTLMPTLTQPSAVVPSW